MALAVVQTVKIEAAAGTTVTVNNAMTLTAGNLAVAGVSCFQGTATNIAASDSVNGAYTGRTARDGGNPGWRFLDKASITGGLVNLTANGGVSTAGLVGIWTEISGAATTTPFDTENGATGTSTAPDTVNVSNAQADSIFLAGGSFAGAGSPITYTINATGSEGTWITADSTNSVELNGNSFPACGVVYQIVSSSSARSHTWTTANAAWAVSSVIYKAAATTANPFPPSEIFRLPPVGLTRRQDFQFNSPTQLFGKDVFFRGAGQAPDYDYPNPTAWRTVSDRWPISLRTHLNPMEPFTGQDVFFGDAGKAPNFDWPNPAGLAARTTTLWPIVLRTNINIPSTELAGQDVMFGGPGQPVQHDPPQNPRGYPFPIDGRTTADSSEFWFLKDTFFGGAGQPPTYQPPDNPKGYRFANEFRTLTGNLLETTLFFTLAPFYLSDWPNPRGYWFPLDGRSFTDASEFWMLQDTFFGAAGQPPTHQLPDNPNGYRFSVEFRTFLQNLLQGTLSFNPVPFNLLDWPNPRGYGFPLEDRSYIDPSEFWFLQDTFFGGPGQPPTSAPPVNPRGYPYPVDLRSILVNLVATTLGILPNPFHTTEWPNPRRYIYSTDLRTFVKGLQQANLTTGQRPFSTASWANPPLKRMSRAQLMDALNLLETTLGAGAPIVVVLRRLLMGAGI